MEQNKLDCCVVRDLLPAYIEELTEPETSAQVAAHLEGCGDCKKLEADLRSQVPVEQAPKKALKFLTHVKRTRLLAAALTLLLTLWCMWWLYDAEFHYPNTEAGRLAAVTDYIVKKDGSGGHTNVGPEDNAHPIAWQEADGHLLIAYGSDGPDNIHGIVHLVRGINGKYEALDASMSPFPYTAGVWGYSISPKGSDQKLFALAGEGCREIYSVQVEFRVFNEEATRYESVFRTYDIPEPNFLWLMDRDDLRESLGVDPEAPMDFFADVRFLDKNGNDVTDQYRDDTVQQTWAGSKGTAETFLLYVYLGIVALLGIVMIRYFLRKD